MCRHLAYLGPPVTLHDLLVAPEHSLLRQSWAPRLQRHGTVNADGFGVGWWDLARRPEAARYRRAVPMWGDRSFASIAGVIQAAAVVAAVRGATPPAPAEESGTAPFAAGRWLFSHNGAVDGWGDGMALSLRAKVSDGRAAGIEGCCDSEVLFALVLDRIDAGASPGEALAATVGLTEGRLNLLVADGRRIAATAWGDTLFVLRVEGGGSVVASEPYDEDPGWEEVPDRSLVEIEDGRVRTSRL